MNPAALQASSLLDVLIVSVLATRGILMAPISPLLIGGLLGLVVLYLMGFDFLKIQAVRYFQLR